MRAVLTILLGSLLLLTQAMAALSPHTLVQARLCRCCGCGSRACCVLQTTPAPTPAPLAQQRSSVETEAVFLLAPVKTAPSVPQFSSSPAPASPEFLRATGLPLYRRHCALLI